MAINWGTIGTVGAAGIAAVALIVSINGSTATESEELGRLKERVKTLQERVSALPDRQQVEGWARSVSGSSVEFEQLPAGIVVASLKRCSDLGDKWGDYKEGAGRMIVGVGKATIAGSERTFRLDEDGGFWEHVLTEDQMPQHDHATIVHLAQNDNRGFGRENFAQPRDFLSVKSSTGRDIGAARTDKAGSSKPHNNMPPYIALNFCKKEG